MIEINERLAIPEDELEFSTSRSGGPGGQNVNKVSTRVTLRFDAARSPSLTDGQRERILSRLRTRLTKDGVLIITSQQHRTQPANRRAVVERFADLLRDALRRLPVRKKTAISRGAKERRLETKQRHSEIKRRRSKKISWEQ